MKNENIGGIRYFNKYNLGIIFRYFFMGGWRSTIIWLFVLIATGTFKLTGAFIVLLIAISTMILKGVYRGIWKPHNPDETNKQ